MVDHVDNSVLQSLLGSLDLIDRDAEAFRVMLRAAESSLTPQQKKQLTALRFSLLAHTNETGRNLFFMTGLFKAGTTWMGLLLNAHPGLCCPPKEMHSFSAQVTELYTGKRLDQLPPSESKVWGENILDSKRAALFWQIVSQCDKPSARRLGGRGPIANIRLLIRAFPEIRIPVIMRDGRDVAVSGAFFHQKFYGQSYDRFFEDPELTRINAEYAVGWGWQFREFYSEAIKVAKEFPDNVLIIKYEDLLADPVQYMGKIYGFLQVANNPDLVKGCVESCSFEKLTGGRKPGEADNKSFFRKGVSGDWQNYFTPEATRRFKEVAGQFLIDAGYEKDMDWSA